MHLRSYFCDKCGRGYSQNECLKDGHTLYCVDCPKSKVVIAGWPMILIGVFMGVMLYVSRGIQHSGEQWVLAPASLGLFLAGVVRMIQEQWRRRHPITPPSAKDDQDAPPEEDSLT